MRGWRSSVLDIGPSPAMVDVAISVAAFVAMLVGMVGGIIETGVAGLGSEVGLVNGGVVGHGLFST